MAKKNQILSQVIANERQLSIFVIKIMLATKSSCNNLISKWSSMYLVTFKNLYSPAISNIIPSFTAIPRAVTLIKQAHLANLMCLFTVQLVSPEVLHLWLHTWWHQSRSSFKRHWNMCRRKEIALIRMKVSGNNSRNWNTIDFISNFD